MIGETLGLVAALVFVLGLAWATLGVLARMQASAASGPGGGPAPLRYLRSLPVGARERLVVVAYQDEELLLGVTAGGVTLLDRRPLSPAADTTESSPSDGWRDRVLGALRRDRRP